MVIEKNRIFKQILLILAAVAIAAAAFFLFWWKGAFLTGMDWQEQEFAFHDGRVFLSNRHVTLYRNDTKAWETNWDWNVQSACHADLDGDGSEELLLLVWKRGSYGDHRPFWVKHNDHDLKQHIFIYRADSNRDSGIRAIWMSSALPYMEGMQTDIKGDVLITDQTGHVNLWRWEDFGLKLYAEDVQTATVMALGDQLLHKSILIKGLPNDDYSYLYFNIRDRVRSADLATLNQETVLVDDKALISDYPRFASPSAIALTVKDLGIDAVSTANNHALDQGMLGVDTTIRKYREENILTVGTHASSEDASDFSAAVSFLDVNGIRFALLGFTYGTNGLVADKPHTVELLSDEERLIRAMDRAREEADALIVFAHWGTEYREEVDPEQKRLAALFAAHGADAVIGTHPHVLQPYEIIREGSHETLVYYSLGNLVSAQQQENCRHGGAASFTVVKYGDHKISLCDPELIGIRTEQGSAIWE